MVSGGDHRAMHESAGGSKMCEERRNESRIGHATIKENLELGELLTLWFQMGER